MAEAVTNSVHTGSAHIVAQAGKIEFHGAGAHPARSRYRDLIRQIAPRALLDRHAELEDLAAFCTAPDPASAYLWVRAPKWAGKTALLSWFALHPPAGTAVVSFFVTARLAEQDHRGAFTEVVMEQLAGLLDQPLPQPLTEVTREAHLHGLLTDAAELCRARGEHLLLLVDGLDEDSGAGASIASVLPGNPVPGLRVLVSGRPNPPVPLDVPQGHPLRSPEVYYPLSQAAQARVIRDDMERELLRLLDGPQLGRDLLGLLTAAAGGLSAGDLAELTATTAGDLRRHLRRTAARLFDVRPSQWRPGSLEEVYLLGHEELHHAAVEHLGAARITEYRDRLHSWAAQHAMAGWPENTPEYLMRGYPRMLARTGDTPRLVALATDHTRHDRMAAYCGDDAVALSEIDQLDTGRDLELTARLCVHRNRLAVRNSLLPVDLLGVWAAVGQGERAEAFIGLFRGEVRDRAWIAVGVAAAAAGDLDLCRRAIAAVRHAGLKVMALAGAAREAAITGRMDEARTWLDRAIESHPGGDDPEVVEALVAGALRVHGLACAEDLARALGGPSSRLAVSAALAVALARAGRRRGARRAMGAAMRALVRSDDAGATARLMSGLVAAGDVEWARFLVAGLRSDLFRCDAQIALARALDQWGRKRDAAEARTAARTMIGDGASESQVIELAAAHAAAGEWDTAVRLVKRLPMKRVDGLVRLAQEMVAQNRIDDARRLADAASQAVVRSSSAPWSTESLEDLAAALASVDAFDHAESIAQSIPAGRRRHLALVSVAAALVQRGQADRARAVVDQVTDSEALAVAPAGLRRRQWASLTLFDGIEPTRASRASDEQCFAWLRQGRWTDVVSALPKTVLMAIAEEVLAISGHCLRLRPSTPTESC